MEFSVAICVYGKDNADHFRTAMESIINQTVPPSEIVLVVDGPIPAPIQVVIQDLLNECAHLKVVYLESNVGHGEARRTAIDQCTHNLIAIMDADDICVPDRFEQQLLRFKKEAELSVVGGNIAEFVRDTNNIIGIRKVPKADFEIKQFIKKRCPFNQMTVMLRRDAVLASGGYIDWYCDEDYYLWIRMMEKGFQFMNIEEVLCYVRVGNDMYQRRGGWRYFNSEARLQRYMLQHKIIGIPRYLVNVLVRFIVQIVIPNSLRGLVFRKFARYSE